MARLVAKRVLSGPRPLVFANPLVPDGLVLFEPAALEVVLRHRQVTTGAPEAGGILLGCRRGLHLHVMHATSPGPKDQGTRVSFVRKDPSHQVRARRVWEQSEHIVDYLGEWHTHPEAAPSPSSTDRLAWIEVLSVRKEQHVFLIAGTLDVIWTGCGEGHTLSPLLPLPDVDQHQRQVQR